jgi:septum site-determining protein MinC
LTAVPPGAPLFELKSASLPLLALLLKSTDCRALAVQFAARFEQDLFDGDPLVLDLSALAPDAPLPDFGALVALLRSHHLQPIALRGGSEALRRLGLAAGLVQADDVVVPLRSHNEPAPTSEPAAAPAPDPAVLAAATLIVDRPLRSGQQVYARGGDVVVLASVSDGAEVMADGSVHVYGPLRGRAIAGARGASCARIFSTAMAPQLVSIAGTWRTTETPLPSEIAGKPAQVRLDGDRLLFESLRA